MWNNLPTAVIEFLFAVRFGFSPFIIFALMMSFIKVIAIHFGRLLLPKLIVQYADMHALTLYIAENDPNELDASGKTLLHYCVEAEEEHTVAGEGVFQLLLKNRASVHTPDKKRISPIDLAIQTGHTRALACLLKDDNIDFDDTVRRTIQLKSPLASIKLVIEFGESKEIFHPDAADPEGRTALQTAASSGPEGQAANLEVVKFLLEKRATINLSDKKGFSPLHEAANCGEKDIAKFLKDNGADMAARSTEGRTAVQLTEMRGGYANWERDWYL